MTLEKDLRPIKLLLRQRKGSMKRIDAQEKLYGKDMPQYYVDKRERTAEQWRVRIMKEINNYVSGAEVCLKMLQTKPLYKDTPTERRRRRKEVERWERRVEKLHAFKTKTEMEVAL